MPEQNTNQQPSESEIQELKAAHPGTKLRLLTVFDASVVIRAPKEAEFVRFQVQAGDDERRPYAIERLLRDCCVWPAPEKLSALIERYPGLPTSVLTDVLELVGMTRAIEKKDL